MTPTEGGWPMTHLLRCFCGQEWRGRRLTFGEANTFLETHIQLDHPDWHDGMNPEGRGPGFFRCLNG